MRTTCSHAMNMARMIQIRNVPDEIHRELKARAARAGQTLSDFLLAELRHLTGCPTLDEIAARIDTLGRLAEPLDITEAVREERDAR